MLRFSFALLALASPMTAIAAGAVDVVSEMFVERTVKQADGKTVTSLVKQKSGPPGTRLVFTHSYRNTSRQPVANFGMTNPIPPGVDFVSTDDASAAVSADGGKTYGPLATAKVRAADGTLRAARPEDVSHVRWTLKAPIPAGGSGRLSFKGTVK